jgi:hypothetical protein
MAPVSNWSFRFDWTSLSTSRSGLRANCGWQRFEYCAKKARSRTFATDDYYLGDEYLFTYANGLGMGLALQRAQSLDTETRLLAVWDGGGAGGRSGAAGTAVNVGLWHSLGLPADILTPNGDAIDPVAPAPGSGPEEGPGHRVLRALLFGDVKGFSKLAERQLPVFADRISLFLAP